MRSQKELPKAAEFLEKRTVSFPKKMSQQELERYICVLKVSFQGMIEKRAFSYLSMFTTTSHPQARSLPSWAHGGWGSGLQMVGRQTWTPGGGVVPESRGGIPPAPR